MSIDTQLKINKFGCDWNVSVTDKAIIINTIQSDGFSFKDSKYGYIVKMTLWRLPSDGTYIFNDVEIGRQPPPSRIASGRYSYRSGQLISVAANPERKQAILDQVTPWAVKWANSEEAKIIVSLWRKDKDSDNLMRISDSLTFWEATQRTSESNANLLREVLAKALAGDLPTDDVCRALTYGYNSPVRKLEAPK